MVTIKESLKILLLYFVLIYSVEAKLYSISDLPSLREAIAEASINQEDDTILLLNGTYDLSSGELIYSDDGGHGLTLKGEEEEKVVLDGGGVSRLFRSASKKVTLSSLVFKNGFSNQSGGAVSLTYGGVVENCQFINNHTNTNGGALFSKSDSYPIKPTFFITKSTFKNNSAAINGGAVYSNNFEVTSSTFESNLAKQGGGVYAAYSASLVLIDDSHFVRNEAIRGSAVWTNVSSFSDGINNMTKITNSHFKHNMGVAIYSANYLEIDGSILKDNIGGAIRGQYPVISNSFIFHNSDFGVYGSTRIKILNSIILDNYDASADAGTLFGRYGAILVNNLIMNNDTGLTIGADNNSGADANSVVVNNVFDNFGSEIASYDKISFPLVTLSNNYINLDEVFVDHESSGNIFTHEQFGLESINDLKFNLLPYSFLIDAGVFSELAGSFDFHGNSRISGGAIDIGPFEFSSSRPTINSFTYSGTAQEFNELTFLTGYTLSNGRDVNEVLYDYLNDGNYTSVNTYNYSKAGSYKVGVKVQDSEGEFSTSTITIYVAELPYSDMTYKQKLIKAISPEYYDDLISEIALENISHFENGIQHVKDNLDDFELFSSTAVKSDQNGDGQGDVLWRNEITGQNWLWTMNGLKISQSKGLISVGLDWDIAGRGDFNGDSKSDILWRNKATGLNYIWLMDGTTATVRKPLNKIADASWKIKSVADFDGDGKSDIFWHHQETGQTYIYLMNGTSIKNKGFSNTVGSEWQVIGK